MKKSSDRRSFLKLGAAAGVFGHAAGGVFGQSYQTGPDERGHEIKNDLLLKDFEPYTCMVTPDTTPQKAKFPAIDAHIHIGAFTRGQSPEEYIQIMDATGVQSLIHWRFFETEDEYFKYRAGTVGMQGRWGCYGIYLPDEVLEKVYRTNIKNLLKI